MAIWVNFEDIVKPRIKRKKVAYSIDENVIKEFNIICKSKKYMKSHIIENLIKMFICVNNEHLS